MLLAILLPFALGANGAVLKPDHAIRQAVAGTATVDLAKPSGTPQHLASGLLYGIPDQPNQIPSSFYTDMGFNYARAGGSQLPAPATGWINGEATFQVSNPGVGEHYMLLNDCSRHVSLLL